MKLGEAKSCSVFGHRNVEITSNLEDKTIKNIEDLIVNHNVLTYRFGSCSNFNHLCHSVVTKLKMKYPQIKRIAYTCKSEICTLESERLKWKKIDSKILEKEIHLLGVEMEIEFKTKYTSGRASYVERNQAMINDSDYCLFYYDENYMPELRKYSKRNHLYYQPKSETKLAYEYAKLKNKEIINIKD